jgi:hypothetical protein
VKNKSKRQFLLHNRYAISGEMVGVVVVAIEAAVIIATVVDW